MNKTYKKKGGNFSPNTNSFRKILQGYLNKTKKSNSVNSAKSNFSSMNNLFYKRDINAEIDDIKEKYEMLLDKLEEYVTNWKGDIKKELNILIRQIINVQDEILNQCKNYKEKQTDECDEYIENFIQKLNGQYGYKNRIKRMIENIENIQSPNYKIKNKSMKNKPKKNKSMRIERDIEIKKKRIIVILEYLLEEIDNYTNNIKNL